MTAPRFKLTPFVVPEQSIHETVASLFDTIIAPPAQWCAYPAGFIKLTQDQVAKLARMGLKRSWPDFLILHHWLYAIEMKREGGKLSRTTIEHNKRGTPLLKEGQVDVFPRLLEAGMRDIAICHSADEALAALERWGIPLRGRIAA